MIDEFEEIKNLINKEYSDNILCDVGGSDFIIVVAERVAELMETNLEVFFNHLYRMDINENSVHQVLNFPNEDESAYVSIARIIIDRQKKRIETKKKYKQNTIEGWDEY